MMNGTMPVKQIFKILRPAECARLVQDLVFKGSEVDLRDGFIHLSTSTQVAETAARHFAGAGNLWLLRISPAVTAESLRWEESRGGALFPHLYRELRMSDVVWIRPLPEGPDGSHKFPTSIIGEHDE